MGKAVDKNGNLRELQIVELAPVSYLPAPPKDRRFRLTDARGVRRELSALYAEFRNGKIDGESARTAGFLLRTLLESIRVDEIERRLEALETGVIRHE